MHRSRALGKSLPPLHHHILPTHAACPSFNRVLIRPPTCSGEGELTLRSNNPVFRSAQLRATPSGTPRIGSGSRTVTTVPSSFRRRVISDEQRWQSQRVLDSVGLGRPERRVTFEAKESSVFQITKRSNTGGITAFGEHYCTPLLLGASKRDATGLALPERDHFWQVTLISGGLALRFPLLRAAYTSSRTASMLLSEVVQFSTRGCELGHNGGACAPSRMTQPTPPSFGSRG